MSVVMTSFSDRFLQYDIINNVIITEILYDFHVEISKISMLFSQISHESWYIQRFWIQGWGNRNVDDDKCAKMPILSYIRRLNKCLFMLFIQIIINTKCLVYIYSLDFALIIYVTKIRQIHVSQFWHGTGPISLFVVLPLWSLYFLRQNVSLIYEVLVLRILQDNLLSCPYISYWKGFRF